MQEERIIKESKLAIDAFSQSKGLNSNDVLRGEIGEGRKLNMFMEEIRAYLSNQKSGNSK